MPKLRESCETKKGMFDQIETGEEVEVEKIEQRDSKMERLDRIKRELYETMTKPQVKKEVTPKTSELHSDIRKVLDIDQQVMNFNCYLPGKMLGSNLMIGNLTDFDQIIELSVDSNSYKYNVQETISRYPESKGLSDSMPFDIQLSGKEWMVNSEMKHESWFIENPVSKELTKRITLKLGPKSQ